MNNQAISAEFPFQSHFVNVLDSKIHYVDVGEGDPFLFLHGNPTSCYLWRNVIPHLQTSGRCVAPDLIGMGQSGKPAIDYSLQEHIAYIDSFIDTLGLTDITLVVHDWGSAIGLAVAMAKPERIKAIAMMEAHLRPIASWDDFADDPQMIEGFKAFRTPGVGEDLIMEKNLFLTQLLPSCVKRGLTEAEMAHYSAPFPTPESRKPLWRFPNMIPVEGYPEDSAAIFADYSAKLCASELPKLLIWFNGGVIIKQQELNWARENLKNLTLAQVQDSVHFVQEDDPEGVGTEIAQWYKTL